MNNSRTKNSIKNLLTGFASQLLLIALKFVTRTVFISALGKAYLGINGLFADILTMLSLSELGLDTAINYKLYKPLAENDVRHIRLIMKFYKKAYTFVGFTIIILGAGVIPFLPRIIKDYDSLSGLGINPVFIFVLYLFQSATSYMFLASRSAILKADQKEYIINITNFFMMLVMNVIQIAIIVLFGNFTLYVVVLVLFGVLQNIVNASIAVKKYPQVFEFTEESLDGDEVKDLFKDLGAIFVSKVNNVVVKATDNLVLSTFIGLVVVGTYSNYLLMYTTIKGILGRIYNASKASAGNLFAVSDDAKKNLFFESMNFVTAILYGTAAVGIAVLADEVILCWIGKDYVIPQPFSILMGVEVLFMGIKMNLNQIRNISGLFRQMWIRPLLGIIVNLTVSVGLVQVYGIYGVLIGTIASDILTNFLVDPPIINKYALNGYVSISKYYIRNICYFVILGMIFCIDYYLCHIICPSNGWISIAVHLLICGCSVPTVMLVLYWKTESAQYIVSFAKRLLKKRV